MLSDLDAAALARLRVARAAARELAWTQAAETRTGLPASMAAGQVVPGLVLDLDASIVICHRHVGNATPCGATVFTAHAGMLAGTPIVPGSPSQSFNQVGVVAGRSARPAQAFGMPQSIWN